MSTWLGYVLIEGDHLSDIDQFFKVFGYQKCDSLKDEYSDSPKHKPGLTFESFSICVINGWTVINDAPLNIVDIGSNTDQQERYKQASSNLETKIFSMQSQDVTYTSQYFIFSKGSLIRGFFHDGDNILLDIGNSMPFESKLYKIDIDKPFEVMKELTGVSFNDICDIKQYVVKTFIKV